MLKVAFCRLVFCICLMIGVSTLAAPYKVRVTDPALAKSLTAQGARLIADYDTFQLIETETLLPSGAKVQPANQFNFIELNAGVLDTRLPAVQSFRQSALPLSGRRLHLVHFAGPVKPEWLDALNEQGARIVSYVPQNAFLIYGDAAALARVQSWAQTSPVVQWEGDYAGDFKVHSRARRLNALGNPESTGTDLFAVQLMDDAEANAATLALIDALKREPVKNQFRALDYLNVIVRLPPDQLDQIAAQPDVISIQPYVENQKRDERQNQIVAGNVSGTGPTGPGYLAWLASKGFTQAQFDASGFVVDVSDSGLDNGTQAPGHFGLYKSGDPGQASRVVYNRLVGTPNGGGSTIQGCDGHGTLNTHVIAGFNDFAPGFPHTDAAGFHYGLGVCPFVKVGSSVIFDPAAFTNPNYPNLQSQAYHDGARVSANSWGASVSGAYTVDSQAYDALVRDAQPSGATFSVAGNQQMVIVFAAGNAGPGGSTLDAPGSAKNVITVGASENVRSLSTTNGGNNPAGDSRCLNDSDLAANNLNDLADFSGRGPCTDGRVKPDLVAPGTHITGGVAQSGAPTISGTGTAISCFNASGICGLPGAGTTGNANNFFPLSQQFYTVSSGTSHSTPAVAGACALLRQYFINQSLAIPSPAMTKAVLLNSARYLNGVGANDSLFSTSQGMGELDLSPAFDGAPRILTDQDPTNKFTATGQTRTFTGTIADPDKPFRVTLAWTDAPGNTFGNAFNNDLDLEVTVGGATYKGNVFSGAFSASGGAADGRNNVESVFRPAGVAATFTVRVTAANINSDGVPNEAPSVDQDFALIIYNAVEGPVPVIKAESFALVAETCSSTNGAVDPGEEVTIQFALKNTGSADTTNLIVTLLETNGVAAPSGAQSYGALLAGGGSVTQAFTFTAIGTCGDVINPVLQFQDGATVLGTAAVSIPLGQNSILFSQNFDGVTAPALPAGWTTSTSGAQAVWNTQTTVKDTAPNAAFSAEAANVGVNQLVSPVFVLPSGQSQLSFRNNYILEAGPGTTGYDGAVLEIKIGAGAFTDVIAAGGSFISGGYNRTVSTLFQSPLAGRTAWSGNSGGFITTTLSLPASAGGQAIQLRWRCGTDNSVNGTGWRVDTITLNGAVCCGSSLAEVSIGSSPASIAVNLGGAVTNFLTITNFGPGIAAGVVVTSALPAGVSFVSASSSQGSCSNNSGVVTCTLGTLTNGATASIRIDSTAVSAGSWTNAAGVSSSTLDPILANNIVLTVIAVNSEPTISGFGPQMTFEDIPLGPIPFAIGDAESPASALVLSAASSDTNLVPAGSVVFEGSDTDRTLTLTPGTNRSGTCTVTIIVSDGLASASNSFSLTVEPVNDFPVLAAIPDFIITEGQTFRYTNHATDVESPPQILSFNLTAAPPGVDLNPTNGVLTWTPSEDQGPGTNWISVIVYDDGAPLMSDEKGFTVVVLESNSPPVLDPVANRTVHAGATFWVTNSAVDPDIPANGFTFSLGTNSPAGAAIDPITGIFSWTPPNALANTTNNVTIRATDDGLPPRTGQTTFAVHVAASLRIQSIGHTNDVATITWSAVNGLTYRVQFKDDLNEPTWNDSFPEVTASGPTASKEETMSSATQRYYRVVLVP